LSAYVQILSNLSNDGAKLVANFERNVLRSVFGEIKVNENWRKRYAKEVM
jgi:hypothetical protein